MSVDLDFIAQVTQLGEEIILSERDEMNLCLNVSAERILGFTLYEARGKLLGINMPERFGKSH